MADWSAENLAYRFRAVPAVSRVSMSPLGELWRPSLRLRALFALPRSPARQRSMRLSQRPRGQPRGAIAPAQRLVSRPPERALRWEWRSKDLTARLLPATFGRSSYR